MCCLKPDMQINNFLQVFLDKKTTSLINQRVKKNNLFTTSMIKILKEEEKDKRCLCVCLLLWVIYYVKVIFVFIQSLISFGCLENGFWHTQALIEFAVSSSKAHEVKSGWAVGETRERKMPYSLNKDIEVNLVKVSVRKKI